jgi:hypothetical protein
MKPCRALKKQALLHQSQALRLALQQDVAALAPVFVAADKAHAFWQWLRGQPGWVLAGLAVFALLQPRRMVRWTRRGVLAWGICRRAQAIWQSALSRWQSSRG